MACTIGRTALAHPESPEDMELWLGNSPAVKEIYTPERHPVNNRGELISLILNGEPNYNREKQRLAIAFIETHPRVFLRNVFHRFEEHLVDHSSFFARWKIRSNGFL